SGSALALLLAVACSSNNLGTGNGDGGLIESDDIAAPLDSGKDSTTNDACTYSPVDNDPACPATYSYTFSGQPCVPVGLECGYPGAGDGESNGCYATAVLICTGDAGPGDLDAGEDGGREGTWIAGQ
ncbi:MAG: hypothetical protein ACRELY_22245, partial [Polyangiaceae bacterium]